MTRRLFTALLLGALSVPTAALADSAPMPTVLVFQGQPSTIMSASPDRATFTVRNQSDEEIEVFLYRALLRVDGMRLPMEITGVHLEGQPHEGRSVRVPAAAQLRVTVTFELPEPHRARAAWDIDLHVTSDGPGSWTSSPARITRAPARRRARKWITGPKGPAATPRATRR